MIAAEGHGPGKPGLLPQRFDPGHHHLDSEEDQPQAKPDEKVCAVSIVFYQIHGNTAEADEEHYADGDIEGDDKDEGAVPDTESGQDRDRLRDGEHPGADEAGQDDQGCRGALHDGPGTQAEDQGAGPR